MRKRNYTYLICVNLLLIALSLLVIVVSIMDIRRTDAMTEEIESPEVIEPIILEREVVVEVPVYPDIMSELGDFFLTSYCPCEKCCGEWALNRPTAYGKTVVVTSTGSYAEQGITVAVDPTVIPYGSVLYIDGVGIRIAQDCGGAIKGDRLDIYYDNHSDALNGAYGEHKVWLINQEIEYFS